MWQNYVSSFSNLFLTAHGGCSRRAGKCWHFGRSAEVRHFQCIVALAHILHWGTLDTDKQKLQYNVGKIKTTIQKIQTLTQFVFWLVFFYGFEIIFSGQRNFVFCDFVISDSRHLWRRKLQNRKKRNFACQNKWSQNQQKKKTSQKIICDVFYFIMSFFVNFVFPTFVFNVHWGGSNRIHQGTFVWLHKHSCLFKIESAKKILGFRNSARRSSGSERSWWKSSDADTRFWYTTYYSENVTITKTSINRLDIVLSPSTFVLGFVLLLFVFLFSFFLVLSDHLPNLYAGFFLNASHTSRLTQMHEVDIIKSHLGMCQVILFFFVFDIFFQIYFFLNAEHDFLGGTFPPKKIVRSLFCFFVSCIIYVVYIYTWNKKPKQAPHNFFGRKSAAQKIVFRN